MFNFLEQAEREIGRNNCYEAIEYSLKSLEEGLSWLFIDDEDIQDSDFEELWKIQGVRGLNNGFGVGDS
ncbi:hypothetical protein [Litoribacter populi]|uniref:hypothetical protein n=1 Tax=Litoribacter populi TaxID=2598460 RepID=UPI00117CF8BD|nr:hypothetical protein [Litoribacter populi]